MRPFVVMLALVAATFPLAAPATAEEPARFDAEVVSFDGTKVPITVYRPAGASAADPVPVVLHTHGWGGSRITDGTALPGRLWEAGFGVITIDQRGHGASAAQAKVMHKDFEVRDMMAVLDYAHDELDWVAKETGSGIPKDVVAGGAGYSYAGGMQVQLASRDARVDAIAPEYTWTDLPYSLAPAGVPKSVWLDILLGFALQGGVNYDPRINEWYATMLATDAVPADAMEHFRGASPVIEDIEADVLFLQGISDVLFNLNNAMNGYETLEAKGTSDVRLFTHLTGHVLPGIQPFGTTDERREVFVPETTCGNTHDIIVAWFRETLAGEAGAADAIPEVSWALDDDTCLELGALSTSSTTIELGAIPVPSGAGSLLVPLLDGPVVVAGLPNLRADTTALVESYAFAGLVVLGEEGHQRVVDDQSAPVRIVPGEPLDVDLAGVAVRLDEGDRLFLRLDGANEWFAHNSARVPAPGILLDATLTLPTVE